MQTADQLILIYKKYLLEQCSEEELRLLLRHFEESGETSPLMPLIAAELSKDVSETETDAPVLNLIERVDGHILYELQKRRTKNKTSFRLHPYKWAAIAASISMMAGVYFYNNSKTTQGRQSIYVNDIAPGKNNATLKLANGQTISLSNAKTGVVIDASKLSYNDGEAIKETALGSGSKVAAATAVVSVPFGGTYQIILQDGTHVWLNSGSTLSFPTSFASFSTRSVDLKGEAYFEVAKDKQHPFVVKAQGQEVQVLGTHFNISSYADDASVKTTLLEGSVRVVDIHRHNSGILKPGEQSALTRTGALSIAPANTGEALAWKNGYFNFNNESLPEIMKQLSRWYNIEVSYEGKIPSAHFYAKISRKNNISQVLDALESTNVIHFKVEGRRVTIIQ